MKRISIVVAAVFFLALAVGRVSAQDCDDNAEPITIEFVRKDIYTALHFMSIRYRLHISAQQGMNDLFVTINSATTPGALWATLRNDHGLRVRVNGMFVYITKMPDRLGPNWYRAQRRAFLLEPMLPVMPRADDFPESF